MSLGSFHARVLGLCVPWLCRSLYGVLLLGCLPLWGVWERGQKRLGTWAGLQCVWQELVPSGVGGSCTCVVGHWPPGIRAPAGISGRHLCICIWFVLFLWFSELFGARFLFRSTCGHAPLLLCVSVSPPALSVPVCVLHAHARLSPVQALGTRSLSVSIPSVHTTGLLAANESRSAQGRDQVAPAGPPQAFSGGHTLIRIPGSLLPRSQFLLLPSLLWPVGRTQGHTPSPARPRGLAQCPVSGVRGCSGRGLVRMTPSRSRRLPLPMLT